MIESLLNAPVYNEKGPSDLRVRLNHIRRE